MTPYTVLFMKALFTNDLALVIFLIDALGHTLLNLVLLSILQLDSKNEHPLSLCKIEGQTFCFSNMD